jgi:hypothetical protein
MGNSINIQETIKKARKQLTNEPNLFSGLENDF